MRGSLLIIGLIGTLVGLPLQTGSSQAGEAPKPMAIGPDERQWEYLVVSFGKARFFDTSEAPEMQLAMLVKTGPSSQLGLVGAQEAVVMESQMDTLGRLGWELVSVVGAIGGDQELVLKRPYRADRSAIEKVVLSREAQLQKEKEAATPSAPVAEVAPVPIDLDAVDADARAKAKMEAVRSQAAELLVGLQAGSSFKGTAKVVEVNKGVVAEMSLRVRVDGTSSLLREGCRYRASEAKSLANRVQEVLTKSGVFSTDPYASGSTGLDVSTTVFVTCGGKEHDVAYSLDRLSYKKK